MIELLQCLGYEYDPRFTWGASALVAIGILLAAWAWFPDRWRPRGRVAHVCPRCHYDLRGIAEHAAFPLRCAECGLEIGSEQLLRKPRRVRGLLGIALLVLVAAHITALWPQVNREGWKRLVPSTALVLQPMNVAEWTETRLRQGNFAGMPPVRRNELGRRLTNGELWSWQAWILFKRVERACRARKDYGITPSQYDMAVRLHTTRANARDEEAISLRLARLASSADVPFRIDRDSLFVAGQREDDLAEPAEVNATVARALEQLLDPESWAAFGCWDITPEGVVVTGWSQRASTTRARIYDVSDFRRRSGGSRELIVLIEGAVEPNSWIDLGGTVNSAFAVSGHLVIVATTRVHFQIEDFLEDLRDAVAATPPSLPPYEPLRNPRAFTMRSEFGAGVLDNLRLARTVSIEALRAAGPGLDDGVTEGELDGCDRAAFGLVDGLRMSSPSHPHRMRAE